jgi:predicted DCC family thiol-disulfide oxidoreductase YuxK
MKTLDNKLIIYDSNCKVCSSWKDVVLKITSIPGDKVKAFAEIDSSLSSKVDPDKFKNVMALIDLSNEQTIYGAEGVAYIFSSQYKWVDFILRCKILYKLFTFLYKTQAYNRYIIALPKSKYECDCFPDKVLKYRLSYIVLTFLFSIGFTGILGMSLSDFIKGKSLIQSALEMILIAGAGWTIQLVIALIFMKDKKLDYVGHFGSIMVVGLLVFSPWITLQNIFHFSNLWFPIISIVFSSGVMLWLHYERVKYLKLDQAWTVSWFVLAQSSSVVSIYFFLLK